MAQVKRCTSTALNVGRFAVEKWLCRLCCRGGANFTFHGFSSKALTPRVTAHQEITTCGSEWWNQQVSYEFFSAPMDTVVKGILKAGRPRQAAWNLRNKELGDERTKALFGVLVGDSCVKEVDLSRNDLSEYGGKEIADALSGNTSLEVLKLSGNNLGKDGVQAVFQVDNLLREVALNANKLGAAGGQMLGELLKHNRHLQILDVSRNGLGDVGICAISDSLMFNCSLREINLSHNTFGIFGCTAICKALAHNTSLLKLDISDNLLGSDSGHEISKALLQNSSIQELNMSECGFSDDGMFAIAKALSNPCSLRILDLRRNGIEYSGTEALARALAVNTSLQVLDLSGNGIGEGGGQALSKALRVNSSLRKLRLNYCKLADTGGRAIAEALAVNKSMMHCSMVRNNLEKGTAEALGKSLAANTCLQVLQLQHNCGMHGLASSLGMALVSNTSLMELDLAANPFDTDAVIAFAQMLQVNRTLRCMRADVQLNVSMLPIGEALRDYPRYHFMHVVVQTCTWESMEQQHVIRELGAPTWVAEWTYAQTFLYFWEQNLCKLVAFCMGQHARLGAESVVLMLEDNTMQMISEAYFGVPAGYLMSPAARQRAWEV